jgi:isopentenyl-diphosphate Delta-isomerase
VIELFDIFDDAGRPIGQAPRAEVHRRGLWHRSVNVYLFRSDGRLLLQRRHPDKDVCPGMWDLSVGEHLQPGETYLEAARRGLREELGIDGVEPIAVGGVVAGCFELPEQGVRDCEFQQSFRVATDAAAVPAADEISELQLISLEELRWRFRSAPDQYTPWFRLRATALGIV